MLALEAQGVIAMRLTSIAFGRGTHSHGRLVMFNVTNSGEEAHHDKVRA